MEAVWRYFKVNIGHVNFYRLVESTWERDRAKGSGSNWWECHYSLDWNWGGGVCSAVKRSRCTICLRKFYGSF